jgi:hypothetical protein
MRARGRVSVCNEMRVAVDKVAGANEQTEGEVRGWLMETRPKMGEKNCTRAADERGRAGRALGGGDEETSSWQWASLKQPACAYERRAMQAGEQAGRASQQMEGVLVVAYEKDTWYRRRRQAVCVKPVRVRVLDHAAPKNRHASTPLRLPTPHTNGRRLGKIVPGQGIAVAIPLSLHA